MHCNMYLLVMTFDFDCLNFYKDLHEFYFDKLQPENLNRTVKNQNKSIFHIILVNGVMKKCHNGLLKCIAKLELGIV